MARVRVIKEATCTDPRATSLCFQWCQYLYDDGSSEYGFRFVWRGENGNILPLRGQARIPSMKVIEGFIKQAVKEGWAENTDEDVKDW